MMRIPMLLIPVLALTSAAPHALVATSPAGAKPPLNHSGAWQPAPGLKQVRIWPGEAPNGTFRPQAPESVERYDDAGAVGGTSQAVLNIAVPTMTIMPAKGRKTGAAVIVFPGGGFQKVFIDLEGTEICGWLTAKGVTCIVSKYRAPGGNDFWDSKLRRVLSD